MAVNLEVVKFWIMERESIRRRRKAGRAALDRRCYPCQQSILQRAARRRSRDDLDQRKCTKHFTKAAFFAIKYAGACNARRCSLAGPRTVKRLPTTNKPLAIGARVVVGIFPSQPNMAALPKTGRMRDAASSRSESRRRRRAAAAEAPNKKRSPCAHPRDFSDVVEVGAKRHFSAGADYQQPQSCLARI